MKYVTSYWIIFLSSFAFAAAEAPQTFTLDGRLYSDSAGTTPLTDTDVDLVFQILDNSKTCILYEETRTNFNAGASNGYFTFQIGSVTGDPKRSAGDNGLTMKQVYSNTPVVGLNGKLLSNNATTCAHSPTAGQERFLRVQVTPSSDNVTRILSPFMAIDSVPNAMIAEHAESAGTLGGLAPADVLQVNTSSGYTLSQSNLESIFTTSNFSALTTLLAGNSTLYNRPATNGTTVIPSIASPTSPTAGQVWYNAGNILYHDGSTTRTISTGSSSSVAAGNGSAATPSISFSGDTDTGWYLAGADTLAAATGGVERARIDASGNLGLGSSSPGARLTLGGSATAPSWAAAGIGIRQNSATYTDSSSTGTVGYNYVNAFGVPTLAASTATTYTNASAFSIYPPQPGANVTLTNSTALTVNASTLTGVTSGYGLQVNAPTGATDNYAASFMGGYVGVGVTNPQGPIHFKDAANTNAIALGELQGNTPSTGPAFIGRRARDTAGSPSALQSGDFLATFGARGYLSGGWAPASSASISMVSVDDFTTGRGTKIQFETTPVGSSARAINMVLGANGNLGIGNISSPTAHVHIKAGSASAGNAPLKFATGTNLTTPEDGAMEYSSGALYFTVGSTRYTIPLNGSTGSYTNVTSIANATGDITMSPVATTGAVKIDSGTTSINSMSGALVVTGGVGVSGTINAGGAVNAGTTLSAGTNAFIPQIYGGASAASDIKIDGSSNATKGNVLLSSAGGYVGIGTTAPARLLDISTASNVTGPAASTGTAAIGIMNTDTTTGNSTDVNFISRDLGGVDAMIGKISVVATDHTTSAQSGDMLFITRAAGAKAERMRILSGGNVGIGTTNPTTKLDVAGSGQFTSTNANFTSPVLILSNPTPIVAGNGPLLRFEGASANQMGVLGTAWESSGNTAMIFKTLKATVLTEQMRVSSAGNVGIGTTSPTAVLNIKAGTATAGTAPLKLTAGTNLTTPEAGAIEFDGTNLYYTNASNARQTLATAAGGSFTNVTSIANSSGNIVMSPAASTGAVTIDSGTTSTSSSTGALIVTGGAGVSGNIFAGGTVNAGTTLTAGTSAFIPQIYGSALASGVLRLDGTSNATKGDIYMNATGGKVGIGTTAPTHLLTVAGTGSSVTALEAAVDGAKYGYSEVQMNVRNPSASTPLKQLFAFGSEGTYSDAAALTNNKFYIFDNVTSNYRQIINAAGDVFLAGNMVANTGANAVMTVKSTGNVGIGTTSPDARLHTVTSNTTAYAPAGRNVAVYDSVPLIVNNDHSSAGFVAMQLRNRSAGQGVGEIAVTGGSSNSVMAFGVRDTSAANVVERMRIDASGNVGIGTTASTTPLEIASDTNAAIFISGFATGNPPQISGRFARGTASSPTAALQDDPLLFSGGRGYTSSAAYTANSVAGMYVKAGQNFTSANQGGYVTFETTPNNSTSAARTERLRIDPSGKVGIGTTSPTAVLQLKAGTTGTAPLKLTAGTNLTTPEAGAIEFDGTNLYYTNSSNARQTLATSAGGSFTNVTSIANSGGNIVMSPAATTGAVTVDSGTTSSSSTTGALIVTGGAGVSGDVYAGGTVNAGTTLTAGTSAFIPQVYGSALASGVLRLDGTSHATKGDIYMNATGGKVGVGTTAPAEVFNVSKSDATAYVSSGSSQNYPWTVGNGAAAVIQNSANLNNSGAYLGLVSKETATNTKVGYIGVIAPAGTFGHMVFGGRSGSSNTDERMRIDLTTGNIGVGTTSPITRFDVRGLPFSSSFPQQLYVGDTTAWAQDAGGGISLGGLVDGTGTNYQLGIIKSGKENGTSGNHAGYLAFQTRTNAVTSTTERMRISSAGFVGIGTTAPTFPLTVHGDLSDVNTPFNMGVRDIASMAADVGAGLSLGGKYTTAGAYTTFAGIKAGKANAVDSDTSGYLSFLTRLDPAYATEKMRLTAAGKLGIGTTAPTAIVQIKAGTATAGTAPLKLTQGVNLTTPEAGAIEFDGTNLYYTNSSNARQTLATSAGGSFTNVTSIANSGGNIVMSPAASTGAVTVDSGTASSSSTTGALIVTGGAGVSGNIFAGGTVNAGTTLTAGTSAFIPQIYGSAAASGDIKIDGTSNGTPGNILLATGGAGKVGVGTTAPNTPLEIVSISNSVPLRISRTNNTTQAAGVSIFPAGTLSNANPAWGYGTQVNSSTFSLYTYNGTTTTYRMAVDASGNVGIGTTSPAANLEISVPSSSDAKMGLSDGDVAHGMTGFAPTNTFFAVSAVSSTKGGGNVTGFNDDGTDIGLNLTGVLGSNTPTATVPAINLQGAKKSGTTTASLGASETLLQVQNISAPVMTILGGGSVGIGTTDPKRPLHVAGAATGTVLVEATSATADARKKFISSFDDSLNFGKFTDAMAATTQMTISNTGNVGIGTTSPAFPFHLTNPSNSVVMMESQNNVGAVGSAFLGRRARDSAGSPSATQAGDYLVSFGGRGYGATGWSSTSLASIIAIAQENFTDSAQGSYLSFQATPMGSTFRTEKMAVLGNGNVGIGTSSPTQKLTVTGTIETTSGGVKFPDGTTQTSSANVAIRKPANENRTTTTLADDSNFSFAVVANTTYIVEGTLFLFAPANNSCDHKIAFTTPAGATMTIGIQNMNGTTGYQNYVLSTSGTASGTLDVDLTPAIVRISGTVAVGATAGNLVLQNANFNACSGGTVTLQLGSFIRLTAI